MVDANRTREYLVRYGAVPEVARCRLADEVPRPERRDRVVVETHRGIQLGEVLGDVRGEMEVASGFTVLRLATSSDLDACERMAVTATLEFPVWAQRIREWGLDLQLIDLEWTLDGSKLILYVLNERGPECTRLAIQAAASGLGVIEVQPVDAEGLVSQPMSSGGGCGSGGCGSGGCGH